MRVLRFIAVASLSSMLFCLGVAVFQFCCLNAFLSVAEVKSKKMSPEYHFLMSPEGYDKQLILGSDVNMMASRWSLMSGFQLQKW